MRLRSIIYALALVLSIGAAGCQNSGTKGDTKLTNKNDSVSYALGVLIGENNKQQMKGAPGVDQLNKEILVAAFTTAFKGDSLQIKPEQANGLIQAFFDILYWKIHHYSVWSSQSI